MWVRLPGQSQDRCIECGYDYQVKVRIGGLIVSAMTGRGREIIGRMERRKTAMLCVQETTWRGGKAKELENGDKLHHQGDHGERN